MEDKSASSVAEWSVYESGLKLSASKYYSKKRTLFYTTIRNNNLSYNSGLAEYCRNIVIR